MGRMGPFFAIYEDDVCLHLGLFFRSCLGFEDGFSGGSSLWSVAGIYLKLITPGHFLRLFSCTC